MKTLFLSSGLLLALTICPLGHLQGQKVQNTYESLSQLFQQAARPAEEMEARVKVDKKNPLVWHFLGLSMDELGNEKAAREALEVAHNLDPRQAWHVQSLAEHYFGVGDFEQSQRFYRLALSLETRPQVVANLKSSLAQAEERALVDARLRDEEQAAISHTWILGLLGIAFLGVFVVVAPRIGR